MIRAIHNMLCIRMPPMFLVSVVTGNCIIHGEALRTTYARQPMFGQWCHLDNSENMTTLLYINRAQCVWNCLSNDSCLVVSHNHHLNFCELSPQFCDKVVPNENFTINAYDTERNLCLNWEPPAQYDPRTAVEFLRQADRPKMMVVGRTQDSAGLYPGKYQSSGSTVAYVANASTFVVTGNGCEALLVDHGCMWAWIAYTANIIISVGAVAGGYYGNDVLYVARCMVGIRYTLGYYRPSSHLGYFAHYAAVYNNSNFEIIFIMWLLNCTHCHQDYTWCFSKHMDGTTMCFFNDAHIYIPLNWPSLGVFIAVFNLFHPWLFFLKCSYFTCFGSVHIFPKCFNEAL